MTTGLITADTAPRDTNGLIGLGPGTLLRLAMQLNLISDQERQMAFLGTSVEEQAQAVQAALINRDGAPPAPAQQQQQQPQMPAMQALPPQPAFPSPAVPHTQQQVVPPAPTMSTVQTPVPQPAPTMPAQQPQGMPPIPTMSAPTAPGMPPMPGNRTGAPPQPTAAAPQARPPIPAMPNVGQTQVRQPPLPPGATVTKAAPDGPSVSNDMTQQLVATVGELAKALKDYSSASQAQQNATLTTIRGLLKTQLVVSSQLLNVSPDQLAMLVNSQSVDVDAYLKALQGN